MRPQHFWLLSKVDRNPNLLREVKAAGHEIALHGIDHQRLTNFTSAEVTRRTAAGKARLEDTLGAESVDAPSVRGAAILDLARSSKKPTSLPSCGAGRSGTGRTSHMRHASKRLCRRVTRVLLLAHDSFRMLRTA